MRLRLGGLALVLLVGSAVSACAPDVASPSHVIPSSAPPPERLAQTIQLSATHARAGETIPATLVITNPGATIDISQHGCRPRFAIALTDGRQPPAVAFPASCELGQFLIPRGTTRLPTSVWTSQPACEPGGPAYGLPGCTDSGPPPLPAGQYQAVLVWDGDVALPSAQPVPVTLVAG
jgi:hypothetical protein